MHIDFPLGGRVFALDPAKLTGFAYGAPEDSIPELGTINLGRDHDVPADIFGRAVGWWRGRMQTRRADALVIEPPIAPAELWGRSNYQAMVIGHGLYAIFVGLAMERKIPVIEANVRTWRKYFLGRGDLKRDAAKLASVRLCRLLKWNAPDDNAAEAGGMWAWGCAKIAPRAVRRTEPLFLTGAGNVEPL